MSQFFRVFSAACVLSFGASLVLGHGSGYWAIPASTHMLVGLGTALLNVSLHCLIFAIFTGSGKDTRLLVQDLKLNAEFVKRTKVFKRTVFPPALYAIGAILVTTSLGGAMSKASSLVLAYAHLGAAWFCFFYNLKVILLECRAVKENSEIIDSLNREAAKKATVSPNKSPDLPELADGTVLEWGTHVYALGKFLCFLGFNVWLPYIYLRHIVGWLRTPFWLFLGFSLVCVAGGYYLRWRYGQYRPGLNQLRSLEA